MACGFLNKHAFLNPKLITFAFFLAIATNDLQFVNCWKSAKEKTQLRKEAAKLPSAFSIQPNSPYYTHFLFIPHTYAPPNVEKMRRLSNFLSVIANKHSSRSKTAMYPLQQSTADTSTRLVSTSANKAVAGETTAENESGSGSPPIQDVPSEFSTPEVSLNVSPNGLCHYEIQRSKQLNAVNYDIANAMTPFFLQADSLKYCKAILLTGSGDKAFCSGGDIRQASHAGANYAAKFFSVEYVVDYLTALIAKPFISIWKGIVMGGGVGVSIFGKYRIATDNTLFAMPETGIGFFPDCGVVNVLSKLKGGVGFYIGLTGFRLNAHDVMNYGLATHFIPQSDIPHFIKELKEMDLKSGDGSHEAIESALGKFSGDGFRKIPPNLDDALVANIEEYFGNVSSLEGLIDTLKSNQEDHFCATTLKTLSTRCPISCAVWYQQYKMAPSMSLLDTFRLEYKLSQSFALVDPNFREGVRALIIDKDNKPKWVPESLSEVSSEYVASLFECAGGKELDEMVPWPLVEA